MADNPNTPPPRTPPAPSHLDDPPLLTVHSAVVLLTACFIGAIIGGMTFLTGGPAAGAVLAGLTGAGATTPVLRTLIR
ncbi:hypothetical protein [Wenjunlia tyrosinilytica]|jgi:hypothetical protein|uniref:Uncharacterized protein n=1 Tax=Wenjunlia tyrosinilytica TaxID=1544741 RepID=A0A918E1I5_9ACTN|nr:hypothetical protein [Wenjunlia tyrosinilytica]GGP00298.1 hypothetical protein GCM10012280_68750 [Wenjunlia tyrosinilytica]